MTTPVSNSPRRLTADEERKLRSCLLLWLDNDKEHEALNARGASLRLLNKAGIDPFTFVDRAIAGLVRLDAKANEAPTNSAPRSWRAIAVACSYHLDKLSKKDAAFVRTMVAKPSMYPASLAQKTWLGDIYTKLMGAGHAARP